MTPIEILRGELKVARLEHERLHTIWLNPFSSYDDEVAVHKAWGRWNGIAKAMELLGA